MADFFDTSSQDDLDLLHESIRNHDELDQIVDDVEWEIINVAFMQREGGTRGVVQDFFEYEDGNDPNNELKVRLVGYDSDTPTDSEDDLKEALRRTIARVVSWVLRDYKNPQGVRSIQQGQRSVTYAGSVPSWTEWPDDWDRMLHNYDARIPNYAV
jgi:uncharacterized protein (DUF2267 family)